MTQRHVSPHWSAYTSTGVPDRLRPSHNEVASAQLDSVRPPRRARRPSLAPQRSPAEAAKSPRFSHDLSAARRAAHLGEGTRPAYPCTKTVPASCLVVRSWLVLRCQQQQAGQPSVKRSKTLTGARRALTSTTLRAYSQAATVPPAKRYSATIATTHRPISGKYAVIDNTGDRSDAVTPGGVL